MAEGAPQHVFNLGLGRLTEPSAETRMGTSRVLIRSLKPARFAGRCARYALQLTRRPAASGPGRYTLRVTQRQSLTLFRDLAGNHNVLAPDLRSRTDDLKYTQQCGK